MLAELVGSRTRAAILSRLFLEPDAEFYLRDLVRTTGLGPRTVQQEADRLTRLGLVTERRSGNRRYLRAAKEHPLFTTIRDLVRQTTGVPALVRQALAGDRRIELALLFGSMAAGSERASSDVDLLIAGDIGLRDVLALLAPLRPELGREINPIVMSSDEFRERHRAGEPFLATVLASGPVTLVGSTDDVIG